VTHDSDYPVPYRSECSYRSLRHYTQQGLASLGSMGTQLTGWSCDEAGLGLD